MAALPIPAKTKSPNRLKGKNDGFSDEKINQKKNKQANAPGKI